MPSYQRLNATTNDNNTHPNTVFENPFENRELDDLDPNFSHRQESSHLLESFDGDHESSQRGDVQDRHFQGSENHGFDDRLNHQNHNEDDNGAVIDESLFAEGMNEASTSWTAGMTNTAMQNNGSRNGHLTIPQRICRTVDRVTSHTPGRRFLHRFFPQYVSLATNSQSYHGQVMGNGLQNDGVFSNMMAKPTVTQETTDDNPPSYEEAAADATPLYWESTVFSEYGDGVFVDGLPVGNIVNFVWNLMVSSAFQFVGFLLTYLLHTSHAAKEGSRAGLGITFMSYGYYMVPDGHWLSSSISSWRGGAHDIDTKFEPVDPNNFDVDSNHVLEGSVDDFHSSIDGQDTSNTASTDYTTSYFDENSTPIFAYGLVAVGVFIFIKSLLDYHRAKQMEKVILQSPSTTYETPAAETEAEEV
ncbi:Bsd2 protein [Saccharomycopsis crataegensis]|uniref:Bsd2 protein n=1 Tax=Saccharomycopsis crataegensis TaxID=43959 RepID=A0AAV5QPV5_9ASCO|nr:Bsd2 protein [Saccharomycopsis crataegensis]